MTFNWPPSYVLHRSSRAKRIKLRICPKRGLMLVVPIHSAEKAALAFLEQQKTWVLEHQHFLQPKLNATSCPASIHLQAINKTWQIRYEKISGQKNITLLQLPSELVLYGGNMTVESCLSKLNEWLQALAQKEFYRWLKKLSVQCSLPFNQLNIRNQATRWGSCSSEKNISLNIKLIFLDSMLVEYILIHELCHTKHFNHSRDFWQLVGSFMPNYQECKDQIKKIKSADFPEWI